MVLQNASIFFCCMPVQPHPRGTTCRFVFRQRRPTKGESLGVERIVRHATQLLKFHRAAASAITSSRKEVIIETQSGSEVGGAYFGFSNRQMQFRSSTAISMTKER